MSAAEQTLTRSGSGRRRPRGMPTSGIDNIRCIDISSGAQLRENGEGRHYSYRLSSGCSVVLVDEADEPVAATGPPR
jgi:hypothetical protein